MSNSDSLTIELDSAGFDQLKLELSSTEKPEKIKHLKIIFKSMYNGWITAQNPYFMNGVKVTPQRFKLKDNLDSIPIEIERFKKLKTLDISMLGLKTLPDLSTMKSLEVLTMDFSYINCDNYIDLFLSMNNLKRIDVHFCEYSEEFLEEMKSVRSEITINTENSKLSKEAREKSKRELEELMRLIREGGGDIVDEEGNVIDEKGNIIRKAKIKE